MIVDRTGRPLVSVRKNMGTGNPVDEPQCELMGIPLAISNSMPSSGTSSAYVRLCGDPSFYLTRFVKGLGVQFYKEAQNLIEYGLVCASLVGRADCGVLANPPARPTWNAVVMHS